MNISLSSIRSDVSSAQTEFCKEASCVLNSNGMVSCIPPCKHVSKCSPNYTRWPFDRQNCTIHIGTWVDSGDEIDFKLLKSVVTDDDLSSQNSEWRLIQATYKRDAGNYSNSKDTYPSLTFSFLIERHSASHTVFVLVPAIGKLLCMFYCFVDAVHKVPHDVNETERGIFVAYVYF